MRTLESDLAELRRHRDAIRDAIVVAAADALRLDAASAWLARRLQRFERRDDGSLAEKPGTRQTRS